MCLEKVLYACVSQVQFSEGKASIVCLKDTKKCSNSAVDDVPNKVREKNQGGAANRRRWGGGGRVEGGSSRCMSQLISIQSAW
jgi:hypothetical protein